MIPKTSELIQKQSQWNAKQQAKNQWRVRRERALDYYNGRTERYTEMYFNKNLS